MRRCNSSLAHSPRPAIVAATGIAASARAAGTCASGVNSASGRPLERHGVARLWHLGHDGGPLLRPGWGEPEFRASWPAAKAFSNRSTVTGPRDGGSAILRPRDPPGFPKNCEDGGHLASLAGGAYAFPAGGRSTPESSEIDKTLRRRHGRLPSAERAVPTRRDSQAVFEREPSFPPDPRGHPGT